MLFNKVLFISTFIYFIDRVVENQIKNGIEVSGPNWLALKDAPSPHPISVPWIGVKYQQTQKQMVTRTYIRTRYKTLQLARKVNTWYHG